MRKLRLMPDYECFPLWHADGLEFGDVDPSSLPISDVLRDELMGWAADYDLTLNRDDPARSGFKDDREEAEFIERGRSLAGRLRQELPQDWSVAYFYDEKS